MIALLAPLAGWLAKSALMQSPIGSLVKRIPAKAWLYIALAAAVALAAAWHQHTAHRALRQADKAGYDRAKGEDATALEKAHREALQWKKQAETEHAQLAATIRSKTDAQAAHTNRLADDLLRTGPGKARCGQSDYPSVPASAGQHAAPASGPRSAAVDSVPHPERFDLIALPFSATLSLARQCDLDDGEVRAWREWYAKMVKAWPSAK